VLIQFLNQNIIQSLKKYAHKKEYTSCEGISELNNTLKKIYNNDKMSYNILVGNGLKELLFIIQACFKGKIFHITPSWVSYKEHINILNKNSDLIEIDTNIENNFEINFDLLENELKKNEKYPKLLILNNPNNPTGIYKDNKEIEKVAKLMKKYNCLVFSDEIYLNLTYNKIKYSISNYIPDLVIIGSSVSKDLGCGGYRLGWLAFPKIQENLFNICKSYSSSIYSCAPTPIQYATNDMILNQKLFKKHCNMSIEIYKYISNKVCELLKITDIKFVRPNSSWYIFLNFDNYEKKLLSIDIKSSRDLCSYLIDKIGLISVPGESFNTKGLNLRMSLVDFEIIIKENNIQKFNIDNIIEGIIF
jgi:aspartate aminotransferase